MESLNTLIINDLFTAIDFYVYERPRRSDTFLDLHHTNWRYIYLNPLYIFG